MPVKYPDTIFPVAPRLIKASADMGRDNEVIAIVPHGNIADARVAILMCTKNGAAFIDDQLKSIAIQTHKNWILIVSDDGSHDGTITKLKAVRKGSPSKNHDQEGAG